MAFQVSAASGHSRPPGIGSVLASVKMPLRWTPSERPPIIVGLMRGSPSGQVLSESAHRGRDWCEESTSSGARLQGAVALAAVGVIPSPDVSAAVARPGQLLDELGSVPHGAWRHAGG